ncbi:MAG TPA: extracellular solute-binding protein [Chloroflexota bacterium]
MGAAATAVLAIAACGGNAAPASNGASAPASSTNVASYQGADRQQMLEAGARKEGVVSWYTVMAGDAIQAVSNSFKQKYPFLQVDIFRADAVDIVTRATQEAQAGKQVFDVVDMSSPQIDQLAEAHLFTPYFSPSTASFPAELKFGAKGQMVDSASDWTTIIGFGYNSQLIPDSAVPKKQADLLNPALSGKMTLAGTTTGYNWVGSILKGMGEDNGRKFLDQLGKQQKPAVQQISGKAVLDLVAKGEVPASPTIYRDHVRQAAAQNAPVAWVPLEPAATLATKLYYAAKAPHPNAGLLFVDYMLGAEGQQILKDHFYTTGGEKAPFQIMLIGEGEPPDQALKEQQSWADIFKADFR